MSLPVQSLQTSSRKNGTPRNATRNWIESQSSPMNKRTKSKAGSPGMSNENCLSFDVPLNSIYLLELRQWSQHCRPFSMGSTVCRAKLWITFATLLAPSDIERVFSWSISSSTLDLTLIKESFRTDEGVDDK